MKHKPRFKIDVNPEGGHLDRFILYRRTGWWWTVVEKFHSRSRAVEFMREIETLPEYF